MHSNGPGRRSLEIASTAQHAGVDGKRGAIVAIGGLLTVKQVVGLYRPLLERDTTSKLPASARFVPPPHRGLGNIDRIRTETNDKLCWLYDNLGQEPMHVFGHSLGALLAVMATLDNPEIIASANLLAGAHDGIRKKTTAYWALRLALGNPAEANLLEHDSNFMTEQRERIATEWQPRIPMHIISTATDRLIVPPQGFGIELPGQQARNTLLLPHVPGMKRMAHYLLDKMPTDTEYVNTTYITEHTNIPRNPFVLQCADVLLQNELQPPLVSVPAVTSLIFPSAAEAM